MPKKYQTEFLRYEDLRVYENTVCDRNGNGTDRFGPPWD